LNQNNAGSDKYFTAHITELAERCLQEKNPVWTDFLEPPQLKQAQAILTWILGVRFQALGGYPNSERRRLVVYPDYFITETIPTALAFVEISANSSASLEHRDYLGAITGLGLKREKFGDILVFERSCQMILEPELVQFLEQNLNQIASFPVTVNVIDSEQLNPPQQRLKTIKATVASPRLDAIAAFGYSESRSQMAREIKAERVKVNWVAVNSPDLQLKPGDMISIRGRGRVLFQETTGKSKKGRLGILLIRYL
jgi:RNA-binding protein YlmH